MDFSMTPDPERWEFLQQAYPELAGGGPTERPGPPDPPESPPDDQDRESNWPRIGEPIDWHQLWADGDDQEHWLVEPLISASRLVSIYSSAKIGKSLLMLEIAAGLAAGRSVLGQPPAEPIRVLYIDFENDPRGDVRQRLTAMGYKPDDLAKLRYYSFPTLSALDSHAGGLELLAVVRREQVQLVIIDTVSRAVAGEENSNDTWLQFYRETGLLLKREGVACVRLDHSGKDAARGQRGGSAKSGDVDAVWQLSKIGADLFRLTCDAARQVISTDTLMLARRLGPLHHERVSLDGPAATAATAAGAQLAKCLQWLDELKVPRDAGRTRCRTALQVAGRPVANAILEEAIRRRKNLPGNLPGAILEPYLPGATSGSGGAGPDDA